MEDPSTVFFSADTRGEKGVKIQQTYILDWSYC